MSVDYYFSAGYGAAGTFEEPEDLPGNLKKLDWDNLYDGDLGIALPDGIEFDVGGNNMSGPRRWSIMVKRTVKRVDKYGTTYPESTLNLVTDLGEVTMDEAQMLADVLFRLDIDASIGWRFLVDVS